MPEVWNKDFLHFLHGSHLLLFVVHLPNDGQCLFVFNSASNEKNITVLFL